MTIKYGDSDQYDEPDFCPICESLNKYSDEYFMEHVMMEVDTECTKCGHKNHWAHGHFTMPYNI